MLQGLPLLLPMLLPLLLQLQQLALLAAVLQLALLALLAAGWTSLCPSLGLSSLWRRGASLQLAQRPGLSAPERAGVQTPLQG